MRFSYVRMTESVTAGVNEVTLLPSVAESSTVTALKNALMGDMARLPQILAVPHYVV